MWYFFTILIIISGSLYPAFALGTPQTCDTSILPHRWPSSHIYITDTNGSALYVPLTDHTAIFHDDDVWNTSPYPRTVQVTLTIQYRYTGPQVFNQTQSLQMQACSGPESVKWRFVPIQVDSYNATVSDNRGKVGMDFDSMLGATKSQTVSSPLEQLRFGADSHNVICRQDLQLVIKSEDSSPACVKPDTVNNLVTRGWGKINSEMQTLNTPVSNSIRDTSFINLFLTTNSTVIKQGQAIGVDIWISNTSGNKMTMNYDNNWPWKRLALHPCVVGMPFGVALLEGNYSLQNLTEAKQLSLYQNGTYNCPMERYDQVNTYVFEPSGDNTMLETPARNFTSDMRYSLSVNGFYSHANDFQALVDGEYTIVAGDEWGHIVLQHFAVSNSAQDVSVASIKMIPPYTPGGPIIQLTLENVGTKPITNIKAVLELHNNYTFDFANVASSSPLTPRNYISNTTMLIGGGFQTKVAYPIVISGMEGNTPFVYAMKVQIQG